MDQNTIPNLGESEDVMDEQPVENEDETLRRDREMAQVLTGSEIPEQEVLARVAQHLVERAEIEGLGSIELARREGLAYAPLEVALQLEINNIESESK